MGKAKYLTVRCPTGCEAWLHPAALCEHLRPGHCRGHPWVDDLPDNALVPQPAADKLAAVLPARLVGHPQISQRRIRKPAKGESLDHRVIGSLTIASPIEGIKARRWVAVALAATQRLGETAVLRLLTIEGFNDLEPKVLDGNAFLDCPDCGEPVHHKAIGDHRRKSTVCRWKRAAAEVRDLWYDGWRDPWSIPEAPLTWEVLMARVQWRRQLATVQFPKWTAVLLRGAGATTGTVRSRSHRP